MLNVTVGCANARSDMLAPAPARLIPGPTDRDAAETDNLETPLLKLANFIWRVESLENHL
jgi:hypothetical protein